MASLSWYIARRLAAAVLVLFAVVSGTFLLSHEIPADPARAAAGLHAGEAQIRAVAHQLGLDRSLWSQYSSYLSGVVRGNLGISYVSRTPIEPQIAAAIPATLELVLYSFVLCTVVGVLAGMIAAWRPRRPEAYLVRGLSVLGASLPVFWFAIILQLWLGARLNWFPIIGRLSASYSVPPKITGFYTLDALFAGQWGALGDAFWHLVLPAVSLVAWMFALTARVSEKSFADELGRPYVQTAVSRGVGPARLLWRHVFRNALNPIVTVLGLQFGWLLGGTVLVEIVYSWGGIGSFMYVALQNFDYPEIVAVTLVITVGFVIVNLLVDLLYPLLDPRGAQDLMAATTIAAPAPAPGSSAALRMHRLAGLASRWWPALLVAVWLLLIAVPQVLAYQNPFTIDAVNALAPPSPAHWFGTDEAGRDIFSRCVYGIRDSVGVSIAIVLGAAVVGSILGGLAGLGNRLIDGLVMRTTDVFLAFPYLILAIAIAAAEGPGLQTVLIALTAVWWPGYARVVRGQILVLRELPFVEGARAVNTSTRRIFVRHLLPHLAPQLSVRIAMDVGYAILALTGLSFLGLGAQPPTPELGSLIADARNYTLQAWWYATLPGVFIFAAVVSASVIGGHLEKVMGRSR